MQDKHHGIKILIVQLARLGDIYMTWPSIRALRRKHPDAEIHVLVRPRFQDALKGLEAIDRVVPFPTRGFVEPLITLADGIPKALEIVDQFIESLTVECYDLVINASFSEMSSFLTHEIERAGSQVRGWTRSIFHNNVHFPDEISSYFHAQVGVLKTNRVHLVDLFAALFDVDLAKVDLAPPMLNGDKKNLPEMAAVVHVGASDLGKTAPALFLGRALKKFIEMGWPFPVVLIGAKGEEFLAREIEYHAQSSQVQNLVGLTPLEDLFPLFEKAKFLLGPDSGPMHIATLANLPSLCLSAAEVKFWETGPRAAGSAVFPFHPDHVPASEDFAEILWDFSQGCTRGELILAVDQVPSYDLQETPQDRFDWELVNAIYFDGAFPVCEHVGTVLGAEKLLELTHFLKEQIRMTQRTGLSWTPDFVVRMTTMVKAVAEVVPPLKGLVNWFLTENTRLPHSPEVQYLQALTSLLEAFAKLLNIYHLPDEMEQVKKNG